MSPSVIPRPQHTISRANISEAALKVLYRLKGAGYQAHLVGGGVRDLLLGREPKDFDVATDATPEEVRQVFRNCRLIGRRFRLAHVQFGPDIVEVATFRGSGGAHGAEDAEEECQQERVTGHRDRRLENGRIVRDNVYGTIEEDALRRDFTINALYYNVTDFSVLDFAGGVEDLRQGRLRLIGDPEQRYREDPVRMLRAVRFMSKLGFNLDPACEAPLGTMAGLLHGVPAARLFEEVLKLFHSGNGLSAFERLRHYGLFSHLFPQTEACLTHQEHDFPITFVSRGLDSTDQRVRDGKPVNPAFLFAVLLWEPVRLRQGLLEQQEQESAAAVHQAASEVLARQQDHVAVPKRFALQMREIWSLQHRFEARRGKRPFRLLGHPRFRAAYDFLLLRAQAGEVEQELVDWWTRFQGVGADERGHMTREEAERPRRRRRGGRRRATAGAE
jgi:poly(A) polymerase